MFEKDYKDWTGLGHTDKTSSENQPKEREDAIQENQTHQPTTKADNQQPKDKISVLCDIVLLVSWIGWLRNDPFTQRKKCW